MRWRRRSALSLAAAETEAAGQPTPRAVLAIWTDPAWHSTVVFTSQILAEQGYSVEVIGRLPNSDRSIHGRDEFPRGVTVRKVGWGKTGWRDKVAFLLFVVRVRSAASVPGTTFTVGYDRLGLLASFVAAYGRDQVVLVYNNFDLPTPAHRMLTRSLEKLEDVACRASDVVVASSLARAETIQQNARLRSCPLVLKNCQRLRVAGNRTNFLRNYLRSRGIEHRRIVVRLGSLGPNHGIEATVRSVSSWVAGTILVLGGVGAESYVANLQALVAELHLGERVFVLPSLSREAWYDCLFSADIGIALYETGNINHASMAGAGNKLNLYLSAGIPSIVPPILDFQRFAEETGAAEIADPGDPTSIAAAVNRIVADPIGYDRLCANARAAFVGEYNFERQFAPVLAAVQQAVEQREQAEQLPGKRV